MYVLMHVKDQTEGGDSAAALDSKRELMCFLSIKHVNPLVVI